MAVDPKEINTDIDVDRILQMIDAAMDFMQEYLQVEFPRDKYQVIGEVGRILRTGRASVPFHIELHNQRMNDLVLRVDPRRKRLSVVSPRFPTKRASINGVLRSL